MAETPTISFDAHFARVPGIVSVDFDPDRCVRLLTHPLIGLTPEEMSRLHLYVRPDYSLGYTKEERRAIRAANPDDYTDAASCENVLPGEPLGNPGDVLIALVYGSGYEVNKLLCHEAIHARSLLRLTGMRRIREGFLERYRPQRYALIEAAEEIEADRVAKDVALRGLRKNVITILRDKAASSGARGLVK